MDNVLSAYGVKLFMKSGKEHSVACIYDGIDFPFYFCTKQDGTQFSYYLDAIEYIEYSPERATQLEKRREKEQLNTEGKN